VNTLLAKLQGERKIQRAKDSKTFTGMFDRGELYDKDMENAKAPCQSELEMREIQKRIDGIQDDDSLEKRCEDAELLRDLYMRNGKEEEARELNDKIKQAKGAMKEKENEPPPKMDWSNPSQDMIEDAKKHGLDLTDPLVIQELMRLEREGLGDEPTEDDEGGARDSTGSSPPFELPTDVDMGVTIPWMRYVVLFVIVLCMWRLVDAGVLRWIVVSIWLRIARIPRVLVGTLQPEDEETGGFFAGLYRVLAGAIGIGGEDGEL